MSFLLWKKRRFHGDRLWQIVFTSVFFEHFSRQRGQLLSILLSLLGGELPDEESLHQLARIGRRVKGILPRSPVRAAKHVLKIEKIRKNSRKSTESAVLISKDARSSKVRAVTALQSNILPNRYNYRFPMIFLDFYDVYSFLITV